MYTDRLYTKSTSLPHAIFGMSLACTGYTECIPAFKGLVCIKVVKKLKEFNYFISYVYYVYYILYINYK